MKRRAFTLIELLVVISIIGLLSTIAVVATNSSRIQARDVKRKADLRQISQAIELFADANSRLPYGAGWCTYISNGAYGTGFQTNLAPYLAHLPLDPTLHGQLGDYFYDSLDSSTKYALCAKLEAATGNSYDYTGCTGGSIYNYCIYPNGQ